MFTIMAELSARFRLAPKLGRSWATTYFRCFRRFCYNDQRGLPSMQRPYTIATYMNARIFFASGCIALASCLPAVAQQAADQSAPPKLEKLEEIVTPAAGRSTAGGKQQQDDKQEITQTRERGGRVTEVKVKNGTTGTYYLKPNTPVGSAVPGDAQSDTTRPAQWRIFEFDWKRQQDKKAAAEQAAVPAPPEAAPKK
jgi:hypothetical protein